MFLVWQGIAETSNKLLLPASTDEVARLFYDRLTDLDRLLMECGRLNRSKNHLLAIAKEKCGRLSCSRNLIQSPLVEIFKGPY